MPGMTWTPQEVLARLEKAAGRRRAAARRAGHRTGGGDGRTHSHVIRLNSTKEA